MSHKQVTVRRRVAATAMLAVLLTLVRPVAAHVEYVTDEEAGAGIEFVLEVLADPLNAVLVGGTGLLAAVGIGVYLWVRPTIPDFVVLRSALAEYLTYVPWMLRLSLGLPLIGAGFTGYFFSPSLMTASLEPTAQALLRIFQIGLGFFLLFGLGTRVVAGIGLTSYVVGVLLAPEIVLALEYIPGFLAIALLGSGRPSADHLLIRLGGSKGTYYNRIDPITPLARKAQRRIDPYTAYVPTILRVGLGATFILLGLGEKLMNPGPGLALVEQLNLTALIPVSPGMWVVGAGLAEVAFGVALILGLFTRATAAGAFILFTITLFGLANDPVLAHITMFGIASAIFTLGSGPLSVDAWLESQTDRQRDATPA